MSRSISFPPDEDEIENHDELKMVKVSVVVLLEPDDYSALFPSANNLMKWADALSKGMELEHTSMALVSDIDYNPENPWTFEPTAVLKYKQELANAQQSS